MDFQKKVIYLYDYGNKNKSIGFAKWDIRNGMLRILADIKVIGVEKDGEYEVYADTYKGTRIRLGTLNIRNGFGEFRYMGRSDNIQESGAAYYDTDKFYIIKNGQITFFGEFTEQQRPPECQVSLNPSEQVYTQVTSSEIPPVPILTACSLKDNGYEELYAQKNKVEPFSDEDVFDCVEIEPSDIRRIPNTNWGLINNSFLNHGFYAYRHLILGKQYSGAGYDYVIGVPGVYTRRDKNMANMFGFVHFKFSTRSDIHLSQFGYWYKTLQQ